jgi:hypothetical protein
MARYVIAVYFSEDLSCWDACLNGEEVVEVDREKGSSMPEDERSTDALPYLVLPAWSGKSPIGSPEDGDVRHEHHLINGLHRDLPPVGISNSCEQSPGYSE